MLEDFDPRSDKENFVEILISASCLESHLEFHDVDENDIKFDKFICELENAMRKCPVSEPRELFNTVKEEYTLNMSQEEKESFCLALGQRSMQAIMKRLGRVKNSCIGHMPKSQG